MSLLCISIFAFALLALAEGAALPRRDDSYLAAPRALYYMTNINPNSIVAIPVARNGSLLTPFTSTLTGGSPGADTNAATGGPDSPDALASAGSVAVVDRVCQERKKISSKAAYTSSDFSSFPGFVRCQRRLKHSIHVLYRLL